MESARIAASEAKRKLCSFPPANTFNNGSHDFCVEGVMQQWWGFATSFYTIFLVKRFIFFIINFHCCFLLPIESLQKTEIFVLNTKSFNWINFFRCVLLCQNAFLKSIKQMNSVIQWFNFLSPKKKRRDEIPLRIFLSDMETICSLLFDKSTFFPILWTTILGRSLRVWLMREEVWLNFAFLTMWPENWNFPLSIVFGSLLHGFS